MKLPQSVSKLCFLLAIATAVLITSPQSAVAATNQLTFNPASLRFGRVPVGQTETLAVTLTNAGASSITVSTMDVNVAGFTVNQLTLPLTLAAGQSVGFTVTFAPTATGSDYGKVAFNTNAAYLRLSGWGASSISVLSNPPSLAFGNVQVGSSAALPVTLTNYGNASITISTEQTTGAGFTVNGLSLPLTLTAGQSFTFTVTFSPQSVQQIAGAFQGLNSTPVVGIPLTGTGTDAGQLTITPATANFGNVTVGSSASQSGMLSATGANVTVTSVTDSNSEFTLSGISLPITITAGQGVSYTVTFAPQVTGTATGTLSFLSNAGNSPTVESLTGTGTQSQSHSVSLSWDPSTSQVTGYNVYRAGTSGGPYSKINPSLDPGTLYTDSSVASGQTYYYVTTAVNSSGVESAYSNQAQAVIP